MYAQISLRSVHVLQEGQRLEDLEPFTLLLICHTKDGDEYKYVFLSDYTRKAYSATHVEKLLALCSRAAGVFWCAS